jgi:hypothetical protein
MHLTQKGGNMEVRDRASLKSEILQLAEKIVQLCDDHTSSALVAGTATEVAGKIIATESLLSAHSPFENGENHDLAAPSMADRAGTQ